MAKNWHDKYMAQKGRAVQNAGRMGWPVRSITPYGEQIEIMFLAADGRPEYYMTNNLNAARTVSADDLWSGGGAGYGLSGNGVTLGIWDGDGVRTTHQELNGRVVQRDAAGATSYHATHVAGTMIASGIVAGAKGMSPNASLDAYEWNDDLAEMATAAASGLRTSNHSYSYIRGWYYNSANGIWYWYGDTAVDLQQDFNFGFYSSYSRDWDEITYNAPYYLIVKSAGNDRNDTGPGAGGEHYVWIDGGWQWSSTTRDPDGGAAGYDCIGWIGVAKNILTVGSVLDIPSGYSGPSDVMMSDFSGWGPADDGRIKPDIVANGESVYSTDNRADDAYLTLSGTSMSTPNTTGSLGLLFEQYRSLVGGDMRSATLKGLLIHTADEAGPAEGPDYQFGWGLLNARTAADVIADYASMTATASISEYTLNDSQSFDINFSASGAGSIQVTLCWTDPAGTPPTAQLNPTDLMLVNDLDVRISKNDTTYFPWILDPANPVAAATTGDNFRDNVEKIVIQNPTPGLFTVTVSHKGVLAAPQDYSLIVTGLAESGDFVLREIPFSGGWNWFSLNVEVPDMSLNSALSSIEPNGTFIKNQSSFATYYDGAGWYSSNGLEEIDPKSMYMIKMNMDDQLSIQGVPVYYLNMPIALSDGWNWIGYLPQKANVISGAIAAIEPSGTFIKNQDQFAQYYDGIGWYSSNGLEEMVPGQGYMLRMSADAELIYGTPPVTAAKRIVNPMMPVMDWSVDTHRYEHSMAITGVVQQNGVECMDDNLVVGAFVENECRGQARLRRFPLNGRYEFGLLVHGAANEEIRFKVCDTSSNSVIETSNHVRFEIDGILGDGNNPYAVKAGNMSMSVTIPQYYCLYQNHPNPFNPGTTISYDLAESGDVRLDIYDVCGRLVRILHDGEQAAGHYDVIWDGCNDRGVSIVSGLYFYKLTSGHFSETKKMIFAK